MVYQKNILCIDQSRFALKYYEGEFSAFGFNVYPCRSKDEIFKTLNNTDIHCILCAYELEGTTGPMIAKDLKSNQKFKNIPIIILTSKSDKKYLLETISSGAEDFINKDLDIEIISSKINAVIRFGDLLKKQIELERYRTIHAMMTTIGHEIMNPLSIAYGMIGKSHEDLTERKFQKVLDSLNRIQTVVKKIDDLTNVNIEFDHYSGNSELINIHKKSGT